MRLSLAYSPCPNDTFIFHALAEGLVRVPTVGNGSDGEQGASQPATQLEIVLADIEELNRLAATGSVDVAKISYAAYGHIADEYVLLRAGGALGRGVGPLIVSRDPDLDLAGQRVAIPGGRTTANLLLRLLRTDLELVELRYDRIMPAVASGKVAAGLIIHESRFTYADHGLHSLLDLGSWWENEVGHLVPLGAIVARRSLGSRVHTAVTAAIRASLRHANARPGDSAAYVASHAQEMSPEVRQRHIDLYVNEFSFDVGRDGEAAVRELLDRGSERGLFPPVAGDPFAPYPDATNAVGSTSLVADVERR